MDHPCSNSSVKLCKKLDGLPQGVKRVFNIDIETCSECGGAVKIIASIEDPVVIRKILAHLDEKAATAATAQLPPCRAPPATGLFN